MNGRPFTIVGITPKGFMGANVLLGPEIFLPLGVFDSIENGPERPTDRALERPDQFALTVIGRLKPGVTPEGAGPALGIAAAAVERTFPVEYRGAEFFARPAPRMVLSNAPAGSRDGASSRSGSPSAAVGRGSCGSSSPRGWFSRSWAGRSAR